jgi:RimJ/RimL family protein N-acetyltransferase
LRIARIAGHDRVAPVPPIAARATSSLTARLRYCPRRSMADVLPQPGPLLRGAHVALRARHPEDVPLLHTDLYDDIVTRSRGDSRPWRPLPPDPALSPYAVSGVSQDAALFSVIAVADGELAGEALLWGIDAHNRLAHLGLALRPAFRGRGWAVEIVCLLCIYGFSVLGLNRLQLSTLVDNTPMRRAATRAGFAEEGVLREASWVTGEFADSVVMGQLAADWHDDARVVAVGQ